MFTFKEDTVVLPVLHCVDEHQVLRNAKIAFSSGAHGLFLIDHSARGNIARWYRLVRAEYKDEFIGINPLSGLLSSVRYLKELQDVNALWTDDGGVIDGNVFFAERVNEMGIREQNALWFGGVAFKHQEQPDDLQLTTSNAVKYMSVVTTSGSSTGVKADLDKIKAMYGALGTRRILAIASGLTPENVLDYRPYARYMIVSTGVSYPNPDGYTVDFSPELLKMFVRNAMS